MRRLVFDKVFKHLCLLPIFIYFINISFFVKSLMVNFIICLVGGIFCIFTHSASLTFCIFLLMSNVTIVFIYLLLVIVDF